MFGCSENDLHNNHFTGLRTDVLAHWYRRGDLGVLFNVPVL
jgi:hypothetical protein